MPEVETDATPAPVIQNSPVEVAHFLLIASFSFCFPLAMLAADLESGHGPVTFPSSTPCSHFWRIAAIDWVNFADSFETVDRHLTSACADVVIIMSPAAANAAPSAFSPRLVIIDSPCW